MIRKQCECFPNQFRVDLNITERERKEKFRLDPGVRKIIHSIKIHHNNSRNMVVLETATIGGSLLGGPYAQGAPALKMVPKRFLGLHQWLGPVCTKELKEQIVSWKLGVE